MKTIRIAVAGVLSPFWLLLVADAATAQTSFPMITHATPVAVQRGKTSEITVEGQQNFFGAYEILFEGKGVTAELFCARLQDKIHDLQKHAKPMLTLFDADGRELAANDTFFFADPLLSYTIPKAGTYYLQVRESTYDGDARWVYALAATNRPYVSHVFPMAGN